MPHRVLLMISSMRGGGSEQQTLLLLRHLDRTRFTPHLYLTQRVGDLLDRVPGDVQIHSFDDTPSSGGFYIPGRVLRQQVRHLKSVLVENRIEVIYDRTFHMTMIAGPASQYGGGRIGRLSTIVSPPEQALPLVERRFVGLKRRRLAKAYRQSARVVAVSSQAAASAERYYDLPTGSVRVIQNSVDCDAIGVPASTSIPKPEQCLLLVCVGRMTEEKGHADLIAAVIESESQWPADVPMLRLWMIGDGPLREDLERQAKQSVCRHRFEFLGAQQWPQQYMAAADALVLPSHFEGMPNVVLEAMSLGTPVIATRAGGTIELERDKPTIFWALPRDPKSLADAILRFAQDSDAARNHAAAAKVMIAEHHNVQTTTRVIENLLIEAI